MKQAISAGRSDPAEQSRRSGRHWAWRLLWLAFALYIFEQDVEGILWSSLRQSSAGTLAASFVPSPDFAPGTVRISDIAPDSPLRQPGVARGDHIAFDRRFDFARRLRAGETVGFSLERGGRSSHHVVGAIALSADPGARNYTIGQLLAGITGLITAAVGVFFLWVGRGKPSVTWLGILQITVSMADITPGLWTSTRFDFPLLATLDLVFVSFAPVAAMAFATRFHEENLGPVGSGLRSIWITFLALMLGAILLYDWAWLGFATPAQAMLISIAWSMVNYIGLAFALAILYLGWRRSRSETNRRFAFLLLGFLSFVFAQATYVTLSGVLQDSNWWSNPLIYLCDFLIAVAAPALFGYAILRHKVIDLGFAINRTLVYGIFSSALLLTFGLIEWGSERLLPRESIEASALVNAGVALTIFVVFHRARDFVEHQVERLLFRSWHDNEAALRRFLRHAGFISQPEALAEAAVAEGTRFSHGAGCALYLREGAGYARKAGGLPEAPDPIDLDEIAVVTMRAEHHVVELAESGSALPAALALPFVHRAELHGFILLGAKPSGDAYRPDEVELLGMAGVQLGLDLHALKVEQLERCVSDLEARNAELHRTIMAAIETGCTTDKAGAANAAAARARAIPRKQIAGRPEASVETFLENRRADSGD